MCPEGGDKAGTGQEGGEGLGKGCEEQLRALCLPSPERRMRGDLTALCSFPRRGQGEEGAELFSPGEGSKLPRGGADWP